MRLREFARGAGPGVRQFGKPLAEDSLRAIGPPADELAGCKNEVERLTEARLVLEVPPIASVHGSRVVPATGASRRGGHGRQFHDECGGLQGDALDANAGFRRKQGLQD